MKNKIILVCYCISSIILFTSCSNSAQEVKYVEQIKGQESNILDLQTELSDKDKIVQELKSEINNLSSSLSNLEEKNKELLGNNSMYRKHLEEQKDYLNELEDTQSDINTESFYSKFYKYKYKLNEKNIKDEIIFGIHYGAKESDGGTNTLMGKNSSFLHNSVYNNDWQVDNDSDLFNGKWYSIEIKELIANKQKYEALRELANKKYTFYSIDKKLFETNGSLTINEWLEPFMLFDNPNETGFFISGNYNHIPRDVNVVVNMEYNDDKYDIVKYDDSIDLNSIISAIEPESNNASITQLIECDINGDGKLEKIVNINNTYDDYNYITTNWYELDYDGYMAKLIILDEHNNIIQYIDSIDEKDIKDPMEVCRLFPEILYVIDMNNDGVFEIITEAPIWEGTCYVLNKVNIELKSISQDFYDIGM
jgi:hypothetical protein